MNFFSRNHPLIFLARGWSRSEMSQEFETLLPAVFVRGQPGERDNLPCFEGKDRRDGNETSPVIGILADCMIFFNSMKRSMLLGRPGKMVGFLIAMVVLAAWSALGDVLPPNMRANWMQAGVPGGIPYRTNIFQTLTSANTLADINNAIANCPSNQVVFLGAGTYNINGSIQMQSGVTLRGAGTGSTILVNAQILINNPNYSYPYKSPTVVNWTGGYAQGSNVLTLSSTSSLQVGNILVLYQQNSGIVVGQNGCSTCDFAVDGNHCLMQYVMVSAINGNNATISPGLYSSFWTSTNSPQAAWWPLSYTTVFSGVEDMRINGTVSSQIFDIDCCYACWVRNVYCYQGGNFCIRLWGTKNVEIRHCYLNALTAGDSSGDYGFEFRWSSDFLAEDNIIFAIPNDKWEGISGAVFAFNYGTNFLYNPTTWLGETMMLHGGYPNYNLWEGNYFPNWLADNIKGAGGFNTLFRNRMTGWESGKTGGTYAVAIYPDQYYMNFVGNILGTAGYHSTYQDGGGGGEIYSITATDPVALASVYRHGNYDTVNKAVIWSTNTDHNIPASLHLASKPSYFGSLPWPPFDPNNTTSAAIDRTNIPAGYRYVYGVDPLAGLVNLPPILVASASVYSGIAPLAVSFTGDKSYDPEGVTLTYSWNFGDNTTSTAADPTHTYTTNGVFNVVLQVSDGINTSFTNLTITVPQAGVNPPPTAVITASASAVAVPLVVAFSRASSTDPEGAGLAYTWNFGDDSPPSNLANPSHSYQRSGTFTARLTVADGTNISAAGARDPDPE